MKLVMKIGMSGLREGKNWPKTGEVIDVPDDEATDLLNAGYAEPAKRGDTETASAPKATTTRTK